MYIKRRFRRIRNSETGEFLWLVSLSDMMILLFMFFVALFSFTKQNLTHSEMKRILATLRSRNSATASVKHPEDQIKENLDQWAKTHNLTQQIQVSKKEDGVYLEIKDRVLFGSGEFELHPEGRKAAVTLAEVLKNVPEPYQIGIEGHTDDSPVFSKRIHSNWELSSARALSVMNALNLPPEISKRVVLLAHAEMQPLMPNRDDDGNPIEENQSQNRRVTIRIFTN